MVQQYYGEVGGNGEARAATEPPRLLVPVTESTAGQGIRRMPIKTREIDGNYEGLDWCATVRTNAPLGDLAEMAKLEGAKGMEALGDIYRLMPTVIVRWDIPDEQGNLLPISEAGVRRLPQELLMDVLNKALASGNAAAEVDKSDPPATAELPR